MKLIDVNRNNNLLDFIRYKLDQGQARLDREGTNSFKSYYLAI